MSSIPEAAGRPVDLMARVAAPFVCRACGAEALKWQGQCPQCRDWDALERASMAAGEAISAAPAHGTSLAGAHDGVASLPRLAMGLGELDRVFGGGLVPGSVTLLGGEPGIGKSTLLLQLAAAVAGAQPVLYASGEESVAQIALRSQRLRLTGPKLVLVADNSLDAILQLAREARPVLLLIDSIQTMQHAQVDSGAGSLVQLRECTAALVRHAKGSGAAVIIVGHVTKDGGIAGPKLLEHLVDTVLYFESDAGSRYRLLRATKNRYRTGQ